MAIYYSHCEKPEEIRFDSFDADSWNLDCCLEMTYHDIEIMERCKSNYLGFLRDAIECLRPGSKRKEIEKLFTKVESKMIFSYISLIHNSSYK